MQKTKHHFEKKNLKVDNPKDVERKKLEQRYIKKLGDERLQRLSENADFMSYIYEIIEFTGYYNAEEPNNSEVYIKKGRRQIACLIMDDLAGKTKDGDTKIAALRKLHLKGQLDNNIKLNAKEGS